MKISTDLSRRKECGKSKPEELAIFGSIEEIHFAQPHQQGLMDASSCYPPRVGVEVRFLKSTTFWIRGAVRMHDTN